MSAISGSSSLLLECLELRLAFGGRMVFAIPRWQVERGRHQLVLGPSGSGKTSLLQVIAGLRRPSAGTVRVAGQNLDALGEAARDGFRGRMIGLVFQRLHLIGPLTVAENLRLAQTLAGRLADDEEIARLLDHLGLAPLADRRAATLSQGEAQRLAVARAVINRPRLLLADEPTSALDDENCTRVVNLLLREAEARGATLVVASHDRRLRKRFDVGLALGAAA